MDEMKEMGTLVQELKFEKNLQPELSSEVVLPDYRSEISRLLWVRPTVLPPVSFRGNGNVDLSGKVLYHILYAGPDGKLYSTQAEDTYDVSVPLGEGEDAQFSVIPQVHSVVGRAVAPRRLHLRCRMQIKTMGYEEQDMGEALSPELMSSACLLGGSVEGGRFWSCVGDAVEVGETFSVPAGECGELVTAWAEVLIGEALAGVDSVRLRGEVAMCVLWQAGEGEAYRSKVLSRRVPCSFEVPVINICAEDKVRAWAAVCEVCATEADGQISVAVRFVPVLEGQSNREIYYVKDLFLPHTHTKCRCETKKIWRAHACANRNFSVSELAENVAPGVAGAEIVNAYAEAELAPDAEKNGVRGEMHCHLLYQKDAEFGTVDVSLPIRFEVAGVTPSSHVVCHVPICHARTEGNGVRIDAEVAMALRTAGESEVRLVTEAQTLPMEREERVDLELYYPAAGESLWDVAKRYAVAPADIAAANSMSADRPADEILANEKPYLLMPLL